MDCDGFRYWLAYTKNKISYYRCCRHKVDKCQGRCIVDQAGVTRNVVAHNHAAEPDRVLVDKFRKVLTKRAATESTNLHTIYWDEASQRHLDAALLYTFNDAQSAMRKARRKRHPPVPQTPGALSEMLSDSSLFQVHSGAVPQPFYQQTLALESATCIIFAHLNTLKRIERVEELHVDGSMTISENYHLLTLHSVQKDQSTPIMFVVTTNRTQLVYASVFAYVRENYSTFVAPTVVVTNFERNIQEAIALTFPEATIKGFWFEYTMDVLREVKTLNLQRQTTRGHGSSCLRMLMVLPLLPADYIAPGLDAVRKWASEKSILTPEMSALCAHITSNWLRSMGPHKMSVFGMPHAYQNHAQQFNKELNDSLNSQQAGKRTIWKALEIITQIATRTYVRVKKQHRRTEPSTSSEKPTASAAPSASQTPTSKMEITKTKKSSQVRSEIINDANHLWIRTPVHLRSPLHFLQISSHCINDTIYNANLDELYDRNHVEETNTLAPSTSLSGGTAAPAKSQAITPNRTARPFTNTTDLHFNSVMTLDHTYSFDLNSASCMYENQSVETETSTNTATTSRDKSPHTPEGHVRSSVQPEEPPTTNLSKIVAVRSIDPPPLAFFAKPRGGGKRTLNVINRSSEPPPLVPIRYTIAPGTSPKMKRVQ